MLCDRSPAAGNDEAAPAGKACPVRKAAGGGYTLYYFTAAGPQQNQYLLLRMHVPKKGKIEQKVFLDQMTKVAMLQFLLARGKSVSKVGWI